MHLGAGDSYQCQGSQPLLAVNAHGTRHDTPRDRQRCMRFPRALPNDASRSRTTRKQRPGAVPTSHRDQNNQCAKQSPSYSARVDMCKREQGDIPVVAKTRPPPRPTVVTALVSAWVGDHHAPHLHDISRYRPLSIDPSPTYFLASGGGKAIPGVVPRPRVGSTGTLERGEQSGTPGTISGSPHLISGRTGERRWQQTRRGQLSASSQKLPCPPLPSLLALQARVGVRFEAFLV